MGNEATKRIKIRKEIMVNLGFGKKLSRGSFIEMGNEEYVSKWAMKQ